MPNPIKYTTTGDTLSLKKSNFYIGTGDVGKGPTSSSDYWNGITPPSGGYTIYINKSSNGPSIYVAQNDAGLITLTNIIGSQSFTTVAQCLNWFRTQTDKMVLNIDYPAIPTSGITFISDVGVTTSYPLNGTTSYSMDTVGNGGFVEYQNGPAYISEYGGGFQFDGIDDVAYNSVTSGGFGIFNTAAFTWVMICRSTQSTWSANGGMGSNRYTDGTGWLMNNVSGTKNVTFYMGNVGSPFAATIGTITPTDITVPHMYVISSNGTNQHKGYVDNGTPVSISTSLTRAAAQHELLWGRDGYISGTNLKMVSYVQIMYNRQLSDTEVLSLFNAYVTRFNMYDPDASAFFTAAGITDTTQKTAVNNLVIGLKADSLWTKMTVIYPFVGGSATTHKFNLKDPRDLDAAYRIQFFGGWTHNANGITGNGTNGYANTFAQMNTVAIPDRLNHWSSYSRTLPSGSGMRYVSGILDFNSPFKFFGYGIEPSGSNAVPGLQNFESNGFPLAAGFFNGTVTSNTVARFYRNGVLNYTPSGTINSMTALSNFFIGACNTSTSPGTAFDYNNTNFAFWSLGGALTATDAANFYTRVQAFQTTLGRQI